jgi:hypothetical protein
LKKKFLREAYSEVQGISNDFNDDSIAIKEVTVE